MRLSFGVAAILAGILLAASDVRAQAPDNDTCQACHAEPSMTRADGSAVVVPSDAFGASVHSFMGCVDCHADLATTTDFPHPEELAPVDCASCHDEPAVALTRSVHAKVATPGGGAIGCVNCHGPPHEIRASSDLDSPTHRLRTASTCGVCHSDTVPASSPRGPAVAAAFADSIHGQALARSGLVVAPTCTNCHRSHDVRPVADRESPVHASNVPATCGTCHAGAEREFRDSVHHEVLAENAEGAPHCASCHTAHGISRTESDRWQLSAVEECGTCHREALATYRDTFHGQVTNLGFTPVAKCVDCHASHRVFRVSDPRSTVSSANLVTTCRTCHPAANENFVQYQPHASKDDPERSPALYYTARFMNGLMVGVFAFFGLHTVLWFVRERVRRDPGGDDEGADDAPGDDGERRG